MQFAGAVIQRTHPRRREAEFDMPGPIDAPIHDPDQDLLARAPRAEILAVQLAAFDASDGLVVGVLGPWGSGKTSFLNLLRPHLAKWAALVLEFNPWTFSGTDQLDGAFFVELAAAMRADTRLQRIGKKLAKYADALSYLDWLPGIERVAKASQAIWRWREKRQGGVAGERARVQQALAELDRPVVVILDDIDRLSGSEIRAVFKLIRLVARLPNIVYVVAFDRERVAAALDEEGMPGREYLDKILQLAVDLPHVPDDLLSNATFAALDALLQDDATSAPLDSQVWPDVYAEVIKPLISTMRDVRRFAASLQVTLHELSGAIAFTDAAALEALRLFLPDTYSRLSQMVDALTTTASSYMGSYQVPDPHQASVVALVDEAHNTEVARSLVQQLFPAAARHIGGMSYMSDFERRWRRERRVAHGDNLRFFLQRVPSASLRQFRLAETIRPLMSDPRAFDTAMRSIDARDRQDVITAFEVFQDEFRQEEVVPGIVVLLNLWPDLPERPMAFFSAGTRLAVTRVTLRLLRSLPTPEAIQAATREILPQLSTLAARLELISDVGHRESIGHNLIAEDAAQELEREWCAQVVQAEAAALARERDLLRLLLITKDWCTEEATALRLDDPLLVAAILTDAQGESIANQLGSRSVTRSVRYAWDALVTLFGTEDALGSAIDAVMDAGLLEADVAELVNRYRSGWRPDD